MKYKVIGWDSLDTEEYRYTSNLTQSMIDAIIANIRENKYLFGGDLCEDYAPVLNTGEILDISARVFGKIMGYAHSKTGNNEENYDFYMTMFIKDEYIKFPSSDVDDTLIRPISELRERFDEELSEEEYINIRSLKQKYLVRLNTSKYDHIDVEDEMKCSNFNVDIDIYFDKFIKYDYKYFYDDNAYEFTVRVTNKLYYRNIHNFLFGFAENNKLQFLKEELGFTKETKINEIIDYFEKKYKKEDIEKYGLAVFALQRLNHKIECCIETQSELAYTKEFYSDLSKFTNNFQRVYWNKYYKNKDISLSNSLLINSIFKYKVDKINDVVLEVLKPFLDKKEEFYDFVNKYKLITYLHINVKTIDTSRDLKPKLYCLDDDELEFINKCNIKVQFFYK